MKVAIKITKNNQDKNQTEPKKVFEIKTKCQCGYECGCEFECEFKTEDNKTNTTTTTTITTATTTTNTVTKENDVIFNSKSPLHSREPLKRLKRKPNKSTI